MGGGGAASHDRVGTADALRQATRALHRTAERTGIVRDILRGEVGREGYALFLANLLPAYREMEIGLERHRGAPAIAPLALPPLYRAARIAADLEALAGAGWRTLLPLLPEAERYAGRVAAAAEGSGARLIAHAYVRYLGDLNGGQAIRSVLARSLGLGEAGLSFYEFPEVGDLDRFKAGWRDAIDRAGHAAGNPDALIEEAAEAFRLNIALAEAVQRWVARRSGALSAR